MIERGEGQSAPEFVYYEVFCYNAMYMVDALTLRQIFRTITFTGHER